MGPAFRAICGANFLGSNESHINPNIYAKFGREPTVVSKKGGYRQTDRQTKVHCSFIITRCAFSRSRETI